MPVTVIITDLPEPVRCDKWLAARWPGVSRARWQKVLQEGGVTRSGRALKVTDRVSAGDELELPPVESLMESDAATAPEAEDWPLSILFEDDALVVVDKPEGMVVHPGAGVERGTLVAALLHRYGSLPDLGDVERPGIVHRLDKGTSGLMLVARTQEAGRNLQSQFAERQTEKEYLAVVQGKMPALSGTIDKPIGRHPVARMKMACREDGRTAITHWQVIHDGPGWSLCRITIETGRTHQIRVHLASLGNPVLGDKLYGFKAAKLPAQVPEPGRILLHAHRLAFNHPVDGRRMNFTCPAPQAFYFAQD